MSTQTETDINFEYVNPDRSTGSNDSSGVSQFSPSTTVVVVPKARPPTRDDYLSTATRATDSEPFRVRLPPAGSSGVFDPSVIQRAHVSESARAAFLTSAHLNDPRTRRPGTQGTMRPVLRSHLAIDGPAPAPSAPRDSRPLPPQIPPFGRNREGGAFFARPEGIRFMYIEPAWVMRTSPEVSVSPSISFPQEVTRGDPETNPEA